MMVNPGGQQMQPMMYQGQPPPQMQGMMNQGMMNPGMMNQGMMVGPNPNMQYGMQPGMPMQGDNEDNKKTKGIMTPAIEQLAMVMNSIDPPNSPFYFKPIDGFHYGYLNHKLCCQRFEWEEDSFEFAMQPAEEYKELMDGLAIPIYGDINYERKVITTRTGTMMDPIDLYI